jgi:hypothetical protein
VQGNDKDLSRKKSIGISPERVNIYSDSKVVQSIKSYEEALRVLNKSLLTQNYVAGKKLYPGRY